MNNKIKKKMMMWSMAFVLSGMLTGALYNCGQIVYASENCEEETEETDTEIEKDFVPEDETEAEVFLEEDSNKESGTEDSGELLYTGDFKDDAEESGDGDTPRAEDGDFLLSASADTDSVKAGSNLIYTIHLENPGSVPIQNICLKYRISENISAGIWTENDMDMVGEKIYIDKLDAGMEKWLYLTFALPEEQESDVSVMLTADAEAVYKDRTERITRQQTVETEVEPLKISFEVTKTADRSVAVPGDRIIFSICIRNTGERTLHSVITTERFQLGNVPVEFVEKEGITLNKNKTKARIDQILPGKAAGLEAVVTLPDGIVDQKLLNEVTVTTQETGEKVQTSQAQIQVKGNTVLPTPAGAEPEEDETGEESRRISGNPKTGDPFYPFVWICVILCSLNLTVWICIRM